MRLTSAARRWVAALAVALTVGTALPPPSYATESAVWAGACALISLRVTVSNNQTVGPTPAQRSATFTGSTTCTVQRSSTPLLNVPVTFRGSFTALSASWSCNSGLLVGTGELLVSDPNWPNPPLSVVVLSTAHGITIGAWDIFNSFRFVGAGTMVQTTLCDLTPASQLTWVGPLVFEDPTVEP